MIGKARHRLLVLVAAAVAAAHPALAEYDREGRYVPSPLGIPADPYARPIPQYSGKPGDAIGTPVWPRGTPSAPPPAMLPRPELPSTVRPTNTLPVPLTVEQCEDGWSKSLRLTPVEFNRRCRRLLRK